MKFHSTLPSLETIARVNNSTIGAAAEVGELVFLSGIVSMDMATGKVLSDATPLDASHAAIDLVEAVLGDLGLGLDHVLKVNTFLSDASVFQGWSDAFNERFGAPRPLRTTVMAGLLGATVELDVVAARATRDSSAA